MSLKLKLLPVKPKPTQGLKNLNSQSRMHNSILSSGFSYSGPLVSSLSVFVVLVIVSAIVPSIKGFSVGVPPLRSVCTTMTPQHHDYKPQGTDPPFVVSVDRTSVGGGGEVKVNVASMEPDVTKFIGFYVQARDDNDSPIGVFSPNKDTKVHSCGGMRANGAHHASGNVKKENVTISWTAPSNFDGEVVFTATTLRDFVTYWVFLQTDPVVVSKAPEPVTSTQTRTRPSLFNLNQNGEFRPVERLAGGIRQIFQDVGATVNRITTSVFPSLGNINRNRYSGGGGSGRALGVGDSSAANANNVLSMQTQTENPLGRSPCANVHIFKRLFCILFQSQSQSQNQ